MDNIEELISKIEKGTATKEEELAFLKAINISAEAFKVLIDGVKAEQALNNIKNN